MFQKLALLALLSVVSTTMAGIVDGTWQQLADIPLYPRQEDTGVVINDTTFAILGGVIPFSPQNMTVGNTTAIMQFYDIPTDTWSRGPDIPEPRNHVNAVGYNGKAVCLASFSALKSHTFSAISNAGYTVHHGRP